MPKRKSPVEDESDFSDKQESESEVDASGSASDSKSKSKKKAQQAKSAPPQKKKSKTDNGEGSSDCGGGKVLKNSEGDSYIDLGKKKRATVRTFKGMTLLDIREYYGETGNEKPGKKGISLSLEQWKELKSMAANIDELFAKAKKG